VLPKPNRITDGTDYRAVVRRGARCSGAHTIVYVVTSNEDRAARFGFIVAKNVGSAVRRNAVRRRLKAVCAGALPGVRAGSDIVIRALPSASAASFPELRAEVERCLERRAS
jgi:ribonuclease P protein component